MKVKISIWEIIFLFARANKEQQLQLQQQEEEKLSPFAKRILIVDDDLDITFTFKKAFEEANRISGNKVSFHVNTYNNPLVALSEFKPDFYDLILIDINMPKMNGFDFCAKVFEVDINHFLPNFLHF
ncbi:MAG TPA: response regulator [Nitrososphaeraceae archaeon]|nr:response regulator [Nitrososphaeraceae archaeon]